MQYVQLHFLREFAGAGGTPPTTRQLYEVLALLGYDGYDYEGVLSYLADFTQRWGEPSPDNLLAIARRFAPDHPTHPTHPASNVEANAEMGDVALAGPETPEKEDTIFALAALGILRMPEAPLALLPYLTSPYAVERWLAGLGLATLHEKSALPTLGQILLEFIGPNQPWSSEHGQIIYSFQLWRARLLRLLADWGDPDVVPFMRAALLATVRAEESELREPHGSEEEFVRFGERYTGSEAWDQFHYEQRDWIAEEHQLVYTLGRLGAFGALVGVPTRPGIYYYWRPSPVYVADEAGEIVGKDESSVVNDRVAESRAAEFRGAIWRVHACCGLLEPQFRDQLKWIYFFTDAPEFAAAIERLLEGQFGLDAAERRQAMEDYEHAKYLNGTMADYERFARQAQEDAESE